MLPYTSYLRVYEPARALSPQLHSNLLTGKATLTESLATVAAEQETALRRTVIGSALSDPDERAEVYVLRREGRLHLCPVDLALRSWLSLTALVERADDSSPRWLVPRDTLRAVDERFLHWRRDHPDAVPHIQQATWEVPRTWFTMVADDERELYDAGGFAAVRYRARIGAARRRVAAAHRTLRDLVDDAELLDELVQQAGWLDGFDDASWVEVDYAGLAQILRNRLSDDHSAREVSRALKALRSGDRAGAVAAYRSFEQRWSFVRAFQRAN